MKLFLKKKISDRIAKGHSWIFRSEIADNAEEKWPGSEVDIFSSNGTFIGKGLLSAEENSVAARIYTKDTNQALDFDFWKNKIFQAIEWRSALNKDCRFVRWVNGEIDALPGIIIDQFDEYIIIHLQTLGLEQRKENILNAVKSFFPSKKILFNNNSHIRKNDNLLVENNIIFEPFIYNEKGIKLWISELRDYSIDRILIKKIIRKVSRGKNIWDLCCGNGGLGFNAICGGAKNVTFLDYNEQYFANIDKIISENNLEHQCKTLHKNAFHFLKNNQEKQPDLIILDAPNFNAKENEELLKPYSDLASLSIQNLLPNGGFLIFIISNSKIGFGAMEELFQTVLLSFKLPFNLLQTVVTPPDFGINLLYPHTNYLKAFLLQIPKNYN